MKLRHKSRLATPPIVLAALLASGCAVQPQPLGDVEVDKRVQEDRAVMFAQQEPVSVPMSLHQAMARAIKYNLDHRIRLVENMVASGQLDAAFFSMLPNMNANVARNYRSEYAATTSESIRTGQESLELSKSQEKTRTTSGALFYWNLLDFGVGYAQAKQQGDQVLSAVERRRRALQDLLRDVNQAYWQAVSAEALAQPVDKLLEETQKALDDSIKLEKKGLQEAEKAMDYQQELLERIRQLLSLRKQLELSKTRLASLINLEPGTPLVLDVGERNSQQLPKLTTPLQNLEEMALHARPELRERDYQKRVASLEVRKTLLRLLPGLEFNLSQNYDSNKYQHWKSWHEASLRVSYNILNLFSADTNLRNAETQVSLEEARRLALGSAVLVQVHLAAQQYRRTLEELKISEDILTLGKRRMTRAKAAQEAENKDPLDLIRRKLNVLLAEVQRDMSLAEAQNALGMIYNAVGKDPLPDNPEELTVPALAERLKNQWQQLAEAPTATPPTAGVLEAPAVARGAVSEETTPPPPAAETTGPAAQAVNGKYSVRLAHKTHQTLANLFDQIRNMGLPAFQAQEARQGKSQLAIHAGPFDSDQDARIALDALRARLDVEGQVEPL